jgi:hypothetical protein
LLGRCYILTIFNKQTEGGPWQTYHRNYVCATWRGLSESTASRLLRQNDGGTENIIDPNEFSIRKGKRLSAITSEHTQRSGDWIQPTIDICNNHTNPATQRGYSTAGGLDGILASLRGLGTNIFHPTTPYPVHLDQPANTNNNKQPNKQQLLRRGSKYRSICLRVVVAS